MKLRITAYSNTTEAVAKRLGQGAEKAAHVVAQQVAKDTEQFVPMLTGSLRQNTRIVGDTIIYPGPYARYLYHGKLMVDPETGSAWAKKNATKVLTDKNLVFTKAPPGQPQAHWMEASEALNREKWDKTVVKAVLKYGK